MARLPPPAGAAGAELPRDQFVSRKPTGVRPVSVG